MEYALSFTERPIVDTLTALIADNLFGRFPALKILTVEYGSSWVAGDAAQARSHRAAALEGHVALRRAAAEAERHASARTSG